MQVYSSYDLAKAPLVIAHDFGKGYGGQDFEPAKVRGPLVWGQEAAKFLSPIPFEKRGTHGVVFGVTKDSTRLAVSNSERAIVFDVTSKEELFCLQHEDKVQSLEFSSDGHFLLASTESTRGDGYFDKQIKVWDLAIVEEQAKLCEARNPLLKANMNKLMEEMLKAAETYLTESTQDWSLDQFKSRAEEELRRVLSPVLGRIERRHESAGSGCELSEAKLSGFGSRAWHPSSSTFLFLRDLKKQPQGVNGMVADLVLFDAVSKEEVFVLEGHEGPIMWSGFSPDGEWIASSSWDSKVRIWNSSNGELKHALSEEGLSQSWTGRFSPDFDSIAVGNGDGRLRIWDVKSGNLKFKLEFKRDDQDVERSPGGWVRGIEWVSKSLIFGSQGNGIASIFDLSSTNPTASFSAPKLQNFVQSKGVVRPREISILVVSNDGNRIGFKLWADELVIYDQKKNERWSVVQTLKLEERQPGSSGMKFANDEGTEVWAGGCDGVLRLWKLE